MGEGRHRRRPGGMLPPPQIMGEGEDRISALPDELLHIILLRLCSPRAAARTSVLSRSWRHIWARLPRLILEGPDAPPPASFLDSVDAALASFSAPVVKELHINTPNSCPGVPALRVAPWLRFASQRLVGTLFLIAPLLISSILKPDVGGEEELELPVCEGATTIKLYLEHRWRLRLCPAGVFSALTDLVIKFCRMDGTELTALLSTQCPRLRNLRIQAKLVTLSDISIRSDSLESLWFHVRNMGQLEVITPRLEVLDVSQAIEAHLSAPKLAEVVWNVDTFDPCRHQFTDEGLHLRLLKINHNSLVASLLQRFDTVGELKLSVSISPEIAKYNSFLHETSKLPKCETLSVSSLWNNHGLTPTMFHLLRNCNSIRKFSVQLVDSSNPSLRQPCPLPCPCRLEESCKIDGITLDSLEEIEISFFTCSHEELEFLEQVSRCCVAILKKLVINYTPFPAPPLTKEACEKVRSKFHPNLEVEIYKDWRLVHFD
ncbi:unnamed protein product [Urochloa decumbens]|uniref:F-box domain-containing protein n=1 Tax=Urochloa decumbens TaxID=240449 RepID=A0ABC9FYN7_9POAL